jgi:hypothetical protein
VSTVQRYRLPSSASRLDRATLAVWKVLDGWLATPTGNTIRTVTRLLVGTTAVLVVRDGSTSGPWAMAAAIALVGGVAIGWIGAGRRTTPAAKPPRQRFAVQSVSLVVSLLPVLLLLPLAFVAAALISALLVIPVTDYPWSAGLMLPVSIAVGWLLRRGRIRTNTRYP